MKRSTRNIAIGVVLGLVAVSAALVIYFDPFDIFGRQAKIDERLEAAKVPLDKATALEAQAEQLEASGQHDKAVELGKQAMEQYAEAVRLFEEVYYDTKADKNDRISAAYHIGLIKYARGGPGDRPSGLSLLQVVVRDGKDAVERFEACRVLASYYWDQRDIDSVNSTFQIIMDDKWMRQQVTDALHARENSETGKKDIEFFEAHSDDFGLSRSDLTAEEFTGDDKIYWTQQRLYRTIADNVTAGKTGAEALDTLFDWCRRNVVTLRDEVERDVLTQPYERLLAAHGTDDERAWVYCVLADSLWKYGDEKGAHYYDTMVIKAGNNVLVCAAYGDETRVYDMTMCLPVYGEDGKTPLTLDQLRINADVPLNTGVAGVSYPYKSDDVRNGFYYVPFDPRSASFRQALVLPNSLEEKPVLYRTKDNYRPLYQSVWGQIRQAAHKYFSAPDDMSSYPYNMPDGGVLQLWDVPFDEYDLYRLEGISRTEGEASPRISGLDDVKRKQLDDYMRVTDDLKNALRPLLNGRDMQFRGQYADAAAWYEDEIIENATNPAGAEEIEDAMYYRSLALYDDAREAAGTAAAMDASKDSPKAIADAMAMEAAILKDAETTLLKYAGAYPEGRWIDSVHYHLGLVYEQMGKSAEAKAQFEQVHSSLEDPAKARLK